jgi:hypothetical protein
VDGHKLRVLLKAKELRIRPAHVMTVARRGARLRPLWLAVIGGAALAIGILVYLADRAGSRAWLMPHVAAFTGGPLFGTVGLWLPSLVHPFAFSLLTAAVLRPGAGTCWGACTFWGAVDIAFEIGQHSGLKSYWADALQGSAGDWAITRSVLRYWVHGTFDPLDVCAALLGALAAGAILTCIDHFQGVPHAPN